MLKIISFIAICLVMIGCTTDNGPKAKSNIGSVTKTTKTSKVKSKLYQSVNKNQAILLQKGKDKRYCARCGMDLVKYYKTSHAAIYKGKQYQYCSIHCLEEHLGKGVTLKNPQVVDVTSLKFISVANAKYVVGSKKKGTMSRVSKYAFSSLDDAKKFQAKYGGEIMSFNGARAAAQKDFKFKRKY